MSIICATHLRGPHDGGRDIVVGGEDFGYPKVTQLRGPIALDHHVEGLQVSMDDATTVGVVQG